MLSVSHLVVSPCLGEYLLKNSKKPCLFDLKAPYASCHALYIQTFNETHKNLLAGPGHLVF